MNRFFYIDGEGKQKGTFSVEELKNEPIVRDTLVWSQGMSEWTQARYVPDLQSLFLPGATASQSTAVQPESARANTSNDISQNQPMPQTYMTEAILATLLPFLLCGNIFCLLGIIGIVHASKVESLYLQGAYAEAQEASRQARRWSKIALGIAIGGIILTILFVIGILFFFGSLADFF